jgi:hypothetical protein
LEYPGIFVSILERMGSSVKRLIATVLMVAFLCVVTVGCPSPNASKSPTGTGTGATTPADTKKTDTPADTKKTGS